MPDRLLCDLCNTPMPPHAHYIVRMDIFADPSMPPLSTEELAEMDFDKTMKDLIDEMKHLSADDLQDQVHRRFEFRLCRKCQRQFLANPLGRPRRVRTGEN
ncbi:MAG TPA: hypothetical protein VIL86_02810 [Tepidisphaeraceae bacterium]|jgi:RNase P subunit RPR2